MFFVDKTSVRLNPLKRIDTNSSPSCRSLPQNRRSLARLEVCGVLCRRHDEGL